MHAPPSTIPQPPSEPWRVPLLVKASTVLHLGAAATVIGAPALWPWALGAVVLDHALVAGTGLWPRSTWLGPNLRRLPEASTARREVSVTIDDGPNPLLTPLMLDQLDAANARATFFCIAANAEAHPALCREIVRRGHSVQNHSYRHAHTFSLSSRRAFAAELGRAQDVLAQITGQRPRFFRAPAGLRNPFLAPVLHELQLELVSWTRRGFDTVRRDPADVLTRLTRGLAPGDILLLHDQHAALSASGRPVSLEVLPTLLARLQAEGLRAVTLPEAIAPAPLAEVQALAVQAAA
ncbi:MAG TPA: polysaccharide deacetylase family protein [Burkholderiaceae bacterium]|jgi:peptidoglycan/xylan/chitin deacetylase (PgdA/CDA1 family)